MIHDISKVPPPRSVFKFNSESHFVKVENIPKDGEVMMRSEGSTLRCRERGIPLVPVNGAAVCRRFEERVVRRMVLARWREDV